MAYTWNRNGGVRVSGKLAQGGSNPFPLLSAGDLDWDNVEVESGKHLSTTDDLLNYIKSVKSTNETTWTDEDLESATTGYEIRCDKSVCYKGDQLSNVPISIWKSVGSEYTEIDHDTAVAAGMELVCDLPNNSATSILNWTSSVSYLSGTVNYVGPYVFKLMKGTGANAIELARHVLTVLTPLYKTKVVYVYKHSDSTITTAPVGGTYNFSTGILNPTPDSNSWSTSPSGLTGPIWVSSGFVSEESPSNISWSLPSIYLTHEMTQVEDNHMVKEFAVYKAAVGPYTTIENGQTVQHNKQIPAAPAQTNCYSFATNTFTQPQYWYNEPEAAIAAYKNSQSNQSLKSNYRVWKTYNSYRVTSYDGVIDNNTYQEGTWSTPVEYLNIDKILEDAKTQSQQVADDAIRNARADLVGAEDLETIIDAVNSIFAWSVVEDGANSLPSKYTEIVDGAEGSDDHILYGKFSNYFDSATNKHTGSLELVNANANLCVTGLQMKAIKFDPLYVGGVSQGAKWIAYIPTTTEIRNQISSLNQQTNTLSTAVSAMDPNQIRLQVSKGFKNDVTWTEVPKSDWINARVVMQEDPDDDELDIDEYYNTNVGTVHSEYIRHATVYENGNIVTMQAQYDSSTNQYDFLSALPSKPFDIGVDLNKYDPRGYVYGHYYRVHFGSWSASDQNAGYRYYRCDYPISTGFLNVLSEKVSLGIERSTTSGHEGANLIFSFTKDGSNAAITATNIVLNGDTIADAIFGKSLNINNTTYLCSDGDVYMGVPNNSGINPDASDKTNLNTGGGSSRFNHDGSGQLAGGNIRWSNNGSMWIKDAYIGNSNVWHIGQNQASGSVPFIEAWDYNETTNSGSAMDLIITPLSLSAKLWTPFASNNPDHGKEYWKINRDGTAQFAQNNAYFDSNGNFKLGADTPQSGNQVNGRIAYSASNGTLQISGSKVKIDAGAQLELGSGMQSIAINQLGASVNGPLNTADVYIGGGKCFFKGDNAEIASGVNGVAYGANTAGAGHLANGNIRWNKNGDVSVKGNIEADSMTIKAATFASIDNTAGKMWFTNYQSAKAISGGVIQNASVALRDDDPVILFKRLNENEDGYDFFVLNPLLLGNGAETIRTTQIGALDSSTSSATITDIIADKIYERYLYSNKIEKIDTTSNGSTTITFDSGSYSSLYMFRFVDAPCLYYDDSNNLIYHPFIQGQSQYDKVIEITRLSVSGVNNNGVKRESVYLYPAYSGNGAVESRMSNANGVGYFVSTSYSEYGDFIDPSDGYVHNLSTGQRTQYNNIDSDMKIMIKSDISGYDSVVYLNNSFNYNSLFASHSSDINYVTTGSYSSGADPQLTGIIPSTTTISTLCYCGGNHSIFNS